MTKESRQTHLTGLYERALDVGAHFGQDSAEFFQAVFEYYTALDQMLLAREIRQDCGIFAKAKRVAKYVIYKTLKRWQAKA
jgi:hypothetical protein